MGFELCFSLLQLFELLGFDRFEFIQLLLENRPTLVKNISLEATREAILQAPSKAAQFGFCAFSCQRLLKTFFSLFVFPLSCRFVWSYFMCWFRLPDRQLGFAVSK